ncbi:MAG: hypothetical protein JSS43_16790 [Proteobacteria bacterium]|nr:hypothetical protein [Pseudomonadota bacterium]
MISRVAKLYAERLQATGEAPGINAPTNQDAHDISAAVRLERRKLGLVGDDRMTVRATDGDRSYDLALAQGDRVRLFRTIGATYESGRGGPIGRNGSVPEVVYANAAGKVGTVTWSKLTLNGRISLAYGDATTIHTAQGRSRGEQITAFPDGAGRVSSRVSVPGQAASVGPVIVQRQRLQTGVAAHIQAMKHGPAERDAEGERVVRPAPRVRQEIQRGPSLRI